MAILIVHSAGDWNADLYDQTRQRAVPDPSSPPDGLVAHFAGPGPGGGWRVTEVWESEGHWERFRDETLGPIAQEIQAPPFDTDVGDLHNKIVSEKVLA